jgi:predicted Zn finger-like uncharacterized protein
MAPSDDMKGAAAGPAPPRRFPELERRASAMGALELDPLVTVCPACGNRFTVTEPQLQGARGLVRCARCAVVFDGVDHLVLDAPRAFATTDAAERALDALMQELLSDPTASAAPAAVAAARASPDAAPAERLTTAPAIEAESVVFGQPRQGHWLRTGAFLLVAALGLAAALIWVRYDTLVRDPNWRPFLATVCQPLGCTLPQQRALALIRTRNLSVQRHSDGAAGLLVHVVIVNEAAFPQVFPTVELTFSLPSGVTVAGHRFQPHEYLDGDAHDLTLMPVKRPVQLALRVPDPGPDAVNYRLRLR